MTQRAARPATSSGKKSCRLHATSPLVVALLGLTSCTTPAVPAGDVPIIPDDVADVPMELPIASDGAPVWQDPGAPPDASAPDVTEAPDALPPVDDGSTIDATVEEPLDPDAPAADDGVSADTLDLIDEGAVIIDVLSSADADSVEAVSCDDDDVCTDDTVVSGECQHTPVTCGDKDICTQDLCDPKDGCLHVPVPDACELSPCGPCPVYAGFACVEKGGAWTCESEALGEVFVPAGAYWRGCNPYQPSEQCDKNTKPQHKVYESDFSIDRTEVTHEAFSACGYANGCVVEPAYILNELELQNDTALMPARQLELYAASHYCEWAGKRLCWDAEWEKAARGGCAKHGCADDDDDCCRAAMPLYPWGSTDPICPETADCFMKTPLEVASRPLDRSPYGAMDMAANVAEWCRDGFVQYDELIPIDGSVLVDPEFDGGYDWDTARTVRGGTYMNGDPESPKSIGGLRLDRRWVRPAGQPSITVGIRCCRAFP